MKGKGFFQLENKGEIFVVELKAGCNGFRRGDMLTCRFTTESKPGLVGILERDDCGRWPIPYDESGPEIAAGARLVGQAICLSRDLDNGRAHRDGE